MEYKEMLKRIDNAFRESTAALINEADKLIEHLVMFEKEVSYPLKVIEYQNRRKDIHKKKDIALKSLDMLRSFAIEEAKAYSIYKTEAKNARHRKVSELLNHVADEEYHHFEEYIFMMRHIPAIFTEFTG